MRISEAARRLGTSARMLRYREELGLLPQVRDRLGVARRPGGRGASASRRIHRWLWWRAGNMARGMM